MAPHHSSINTSGEAVKTLQATVFTHMHPCGCRGSYGAVYKAEYGEQKQAVAVKVSLASS